MAHTETILRPLYESDIWYDRLFDITCDGEEFTRVVFSGPFKDLDARGTVWAYTVDNAQDDIVALIHVGEDGKLVDRKGNPVIGHPLN